MEMKEFKPKSFWQRPEGTVGKIFLAGMLIAGGFLLVTILPTLIALASNLLYLSLLLGALGLVVFMALDKRTRNLFSYGYKSIMRFITGLFIQIDPIGILKSYVDDLKDNLKKMNKQMSILRGEMQKLKRTITTNKEQINSNIALAKKAKEKDKQDIMILKSRKAGRLKDSNIRLEELYGKMEVLYRVLTKMYSNSEILLEDVKDQVKVKEIERKAIRTSHSAMKSAMDVLSGNTDKREMFDQALEAIADDVGQKIGEMEEFMEMSTNFMDSIDLQNGVFEEEGMKMLEKWEKEGISIILGDEKDSLINDSTSIDLDAPIAKPGQQRANSGGGNQGNQYDDLFDF